MGKFDGYALDPGGMSIGTDPELFVKAKRTLIPAFDFLPAKDVAPKQCFGFSGDGSIYWDGFQAEFGLGNYSPYCLQEFSMALQNALWHLHKKVKEANPEARLTLENVVKIPQSKLDSADSIHVALGCMPSTNAYGKCGEIIDDPRKLQYRFAGGHIHLGVPATDDIVRTLDKILGIWAVGVAQNLDSPIRRKYYGIAGEYRKPKYKYNEGTEYRVLSNFWLAGPALTMITYELARQCVRLSKAGHSSLWIADIDEIQDTINKCDVKQAKVILKRNEDLFRWILSGRFHGYAIDRAYDIAQDGLEAHFERTIEEEWALDMPGTWKSPYTPQEWKTFASGYKREA